VYTFCCVVFTLLSPFPNTSSLPLVPALPPGRALSTLLFSDLVGKKKRKDKNKTKQYKKTP
jgi:hypothetical protein